MACPRGAPERPSTTDNSYSQQPMNPELVQLPSPRATHRNTLVMRRSCTSGIIAASDHNAPESPACRSLLREAAR